MYGDTPDERKDQPAAPLGVKIVVIILLICGLGLAVLPLTVVLIGGSDEPASPRAAETPPAAPDGQPTEDVEPAVDSGAAPRPTDAPAEDVSATTTESAAQPRGPFERPEGWDEKWDPWFQHIDWVIGPDAGMAAARESGKPMMLFYTATW